MQTTNDIFIQIAAYRDPELVPTIKSIIAEADRPDLLRFGIAWQHSKEDTWDNLDEFKNDRRFRILDIDHKESKGVCWARNQVQQLYEGEKYTLQIDSHHRFSKYWDLRAIHMMNQLHEQGRAKPLLTSYIPSYNPKKDPEGRVMNAWKMNFDRFIPEGAIFFLPGNLDTWDDRNSPIPARFYSAHFCFTLGKFAEEVQHDPEFYFHGEEISIAVRAYTHGYDLFHPHTILAWHEYTRAGRKKQWDDDPVWGEKNKKSHDRNRKLLGVDGIHNDIDFGKYGLGNVRTIKEYERYAGISFRTRSIHKNVKERKTPDNQFMMMGDQEFEASLMREFKHCMDVSKADIPEKDDYDFWAIIFEDKNGKELYRKDAHPNEIQGLYSKSKKDPFLHIWREFKIDERPSQYVVWPHSKSSGWGKKIVHNI